MSCCNENNSPEKSCCTTEKKECKCAIKSFFQKLFGCKKDACSLENKGQGCCGGHTSEKAMNGQCCKNKQRGTRGDVVTSGKFILGLLEKQIEGFTPEQLVQQPGGVKNHPVWSMGHLANTLNNVVGMLGGQKTLPENYKTLFAGGTQPIADVKAYPSAQEIHANLVAMHQKACEFYMGAPSEMLRSPNPNERFAATLPTLGSMVVALLTVHLAEHIGQISAWRRAMGKDPLF